MYHVGVADDDTPTTWVSLGWSQWTAMLRQWAMLHNIVPPGTTDFVLSITGKGNQEYARPFWSSDGFKGQRGYYALPSSLWQRAVLDFLSETPAYREAHIPGQRLYIDFLDSKGTSMFATWRVDYTFPSLPEPEGTEPEEDVKPESEDNPQTTEGPTIYDALLEQE